MVWVDFALRMICCAAIGFAIPHVIYLKMAVADLRRQILYIYAMKVIDLGDEARARGIPCPGCGGADAHSEDCGVYTAKLMMEAEMERIKKEGRSL